MFYDKLNILLKECDTNKERILLGDFNINWSDKAKRKDLKRVMSNFDFQQVVEGPTRITNSSETLIDLVFTNRPERIKKSYNLVTGLSDHNMILILRKLTKQRFNITANVNQEHYKVPNGQLTNLENTIKEINWNEYLANTNVDDNCNRLMCELQTTIQSFMRKVKYKPGKRNYLPWLNENIRSLMKQRDQALKMALRNNVEHEKRLFTTLRNKVVKELKKAKATFFINAISETKGNSKEIWRNLNKLTGKYNTINKKI